MGYILFMVEQRQPGNVHVLTYALDRERAKRNAQRWIEGDPDKYVVTPLTDPGDRIKLDIILNA